MKSLPFFLIFLIPALVLVLLLCSCQKNPNRPERFPPDGVVAASRRRA